MSWSYSGNPSDSTLDLVRFLVGDTNILDQQLQDGEINALISLYTSPMKTAAYAAQAIGTKYARMVDKSVGDLRLSYSQRQKFYQEMQADYLRQSSNRTTTPYAGGISKGDKRILRLDPDATQPDFTKHQFRFHGRVGGSSGEGCEGGGGFD